MLISVVLILLGLGLLVWSADVFVDGAAGVAKSLGMSTLLVGMIVVGFGTSAPEMSVSVLSAMQGNPGIALGNAYGSNITNLALILGVTALISPVIIRSQILRSELPILLGVTLLAFYHLQDMKITRVEAIVELVVLIAVFTWMTLHSKKRAANSDALDEQLEDEFEPMSALAAWSHLIGGLVLLVISSRMLVAGAVDIAHTFGVSDLVIGLTVIAIGTSLPELASSIIAARKGEHDLAVGNVIGSNLFNTLAVVGLAGVIHPMSVPKEVLTRDWGIMMGLTILLCMFAIIKTKPEPETGITRGGGLLLIGIYAAYTIYLINSVIG